MFYTVEDLPVECSFLRNGTPADGILKAYSSKKGKGRSWKKIVKRKIKAAVKSAGTSGCVTSRHCVVKLKLPSNIFQCVLSFFLSGHPSLF